jgi:hypothetical protein
MVNRSTRFSRKAILALASGVKVTVKKVEPIKDVSSVCDLQVQEF